MPRLHDHSSGGRWHLATPFWVVHNIIYLFQHTLEVNTRYRDIMDHLLSRICPERFCFDHTHGPTSSVIDLAGL